MVRIDIISAVPNLLESPLSHSIVQRAREKGLLEIHIHDLRDYSEDRHKKVDDYPYGGGAGMV
ncbi:MAG: tRNA (guanosine(37)-N1)-methyltransferase TrmD, partial [Balneolaceae bacterium]